MWAVDFVQVYDIWFTAPAALPCFARAVGLRAPRPLRGLRALRLGADFDRVARGAGIRVLKTAVQAPLMNRTVRVHMVDESSEVDEHDRRSSAVNATCERFIGSVRRECLDHVVVLGEAHLKAVLLERVAHFDRGRPHQGIEQRVPSPSAEPSSVENGKVVASPVLGGLHHEYRWAA